MMNKTMTMVAPYDSYKVISGFSAEDEYGRREWWLQVLVKEPDGHKFVAYRPADTLRWLTLYYNSVM